MRNITNITLFLLGIPSNVKEPVKHCYSTRSTKSYAEALQGPSTSSIVLQESNPVIEGICYILTYYIYVFLFCFNN